MLQYFSLAPSAIAYIWFRIVLGGKGQTKRAILRALFRRPVCEQFSAVFPTSSLECCDFSRSRLWRSHNLVSYCAGRCAPKKRTFRRALFSRPVFEQFLALFRKSSMKCCNFFSLAPSALACIWFRIVPEGMCKEMHS